MEIEYIIFEQEIIRFLDDHKILVLATSANDRVTARSMSCVNIGLNIYFQTDKRFTKFEQIKHNQQVAICAGNVQIEGTASTGNHITSWKYSDGKSFREFLYVHSHKAEREYYI